MHKQLKPKTLPQLRSSSQQETTPAARANLKALGNYLSRRVNYGKSYYLWLMMLIMLSNIGITRQAIAQVNTNLGLQLTPQGVFDTLYDRFGNSYTPLDIWSSASSTPNNQNAKTTNLISCNNGSYFNLYFEDDCGMKLNNATENARRAILCQVVKDLSAFIPRSATAAPVNIWVRDISQLPSVPSNALAVASGYYVVPNGAVSSGIIETQVWKTINSNVDAFQNVAPPLSTGVGSGGVFYHGYIAFNFSSFTWNTDLQATSFPANQYDLYTVALHEMMHTLGVASLMKENGTGSCLTSIGASSIPGYYSRWDKHIVNGTTNQPIISNGTQTCANGMYNYSFVGNPSDITPAAATCTNHPLKFQFNNSMPTQAIFTPSCYQPGSSMSHFDETAHTASAYNSTGCYPSVGQYYVMSPSSPSSGNTGFLRRFPKYEERDALCTIGYSTSNTFGSSVNQNLMNYSLGSCNNVSIAGTNDGISSTGQYLYTTATVNLTGANLLNNDVLNTTTANANLRFKCLEVLIGGGSFSVIGNSSTATITYNAGTYTGFVLARYIPYDAITLQEGNITYLYMYIAACPNCTPSVCDMISNGGFENVLQGTCGDMAYTPPITLNCWTRYDGTSDLFLRSNISGICNAGNQYRIPTTCSNPSSDTWDVQTGVPQLNGQGVNLNNHFLGLLGVSFISEAVQTNLSSPIMPNQNYRLRFWAKTTDNFQSQVTQHAYLDVLGSATVSCIPIAIPGNLIPSQFGALGLTPLLPNSLPLALNNDHQWHYYDIPITYTGTTPLNRLVVLHANYGGLPQYQYPPYAQNYFYLDDISLTPEAATSILDIHPNFVCANDIIQNIQQYLSPPMPNAVFNGPNGSVVQNAQGGFDFIAANAGLGTHTITCTITDNLGCVQVISDQITVGTGGSLNITKTANGSVFNVGDIVTYTIVVTNPSTSNVVTNIEIEDVLPNQLTLYAGQLNVTIPSLNPGATYTHYISAQVNNITTGCGVLEVENCVSVLDAVGSCVHPSACVSILIKNPSVTVFTNPTSATFGGVISGQTVYINGILSVNTPLTIQNSTIIMLPGSEIQVPFNSKLTINQSTLKGCEKMWKGINLATNPNSSIVQTLFMTASTLQDAERGVTVNDKIEAQIRGCTFKTNVVGIFVPNKLTGLNNVSLAIGASIFDGSGSFLLNYNGQLNPHGTVGYAGWELHDIVNANFTGTYISNTFQNLNIGILATRVNLSISRCRFLNIHQDAFYAGSASPFMPPHGCGIYVIGNGGFFSFSQTGFGNANNNTASFTDCDIAIYTERVDANIQKNRITDNLTQFIGRLGIWVNNSAGRKIIIENNRITSSSYGIFLLNNQSMGIGSSVSYNNITINKNVNPTTAMAGIYASDASPVTSPTLNSNLTIFEDTLFVLKGMNGIILNNIHQAKVTFNRITINPTFNNVVSVREGITLTGAHNNQFNCNWIDGGTYTNGTANNVGFSVNIANNNRIVCNDVAQTYYGFRFNGACTSTQFSANGMNTHFFGLHFSANTTYGIQGSLTHGSGNKWIGTYPSLGGTARHLGTSGNISLCPTYDSPPSPAPASYTPNLIFPITSSVEDNCDGVCTTEIAPPTPPATSTDMAIAQGNITFPEFEASTLWQVNRELYERLADSLVSDSVLQAFMAAQENTSIAAFHALAQVTEAAYAAQANQKAEVTTFEMQMQGWKNQVAFYDSLLHQVPAPLDSANLVVSRNALLAQIIAANEAISTNETDGKALATYQTNLLLTQNGDIEVTAQYEENEKRVNEVFFQTIGREVYSLDAAQIAQLEDIIYQCPLSGGQAVYRARALYAISHPTQTYNDTEACASEGIQWRQAQPQPPVVSLPPIELYPNPATETVSLAYPSDYAGAEVRFYTALGQIATSHRLTEEGKVTYSVADLPVGIYYVHIMGKTPIILKLVVTHF